MESCGSDVHLQLPSDYVFTAVLAESAHGVLARGRRISDGQFVLLKTCDSRWRLERAASVLRHLAGSGVVPELIDARVEDGVMVLSDGGGQSGSTLLGPFAFDCPERFLKIALALARALNTLHSRRVLHGTICPQHYLVQWGDSGEPHVVFIELDSAIRFDEQECAETHAIWQQQQSLAYIAPEQTGQVAMRTDHRCDLYSLGVVLYQLCTGHLPCGASPPPRAAAPSSPRGLASPAPGSSRSSSNSESGEADCSEAMMAQLHEVLFVAPRPACEVNPAVPPLLSAILARLLMKQPDMRYQSAFGLAADLHRCLVEWRAAPCVVYTPDSTGATPITTTTTAATAAPTFALGRTDPPMMFRAPSTLSGRGNELRRLHDVCERAQTTKRPQCVLIEGAAGVGKSALMAAATQHQRAVCISGKFEENRRNVPYCAFAQAFAQLAKRLLVLPRDERRACREKLQAALGNSISLLVEAFPDLERVFGSYSSASAVPDMPTRFNDVIICFLRTLASPSRPLVVVLDDMEWADSSSLHLWEAIMSAEIPSLVFVGAYRSEELTKAPDLADAIAKMRVDALDVEVMQLKPLDRAAVSDLIQSCVLMDADASLALADTLVAKTLGNPFFLIHYLKRLYDEQVLNFDGESGLWVCNAEQVASKELAVNAAQLMLAALAKLDPEIRKPLLLASCIAGEFTVAQLAVASGVPEEAMRRKLQTAVDLSLIYVTCPTVYKFCHDHVRTAANSMLSEAEREEYHLRLARLMIRILSKEELADELFDLVAHFSRASALITDPEEIRRVVVWHSSAADRAIRSAAHACAVTFAGDGLKFLHRLSPNPWETHYELTFKLSLSLMSSLNWVGSTQRAEEQFRDIVARAATATHRADAYLAMLQFYITSDITSKAIWPLASELCVAVGIPPCDTIPSDEETLDRVVEARRALEERTLAGIEALPESGAEVLTQRCLGTLVVAAYLTSPNLVVTLACRSVLLLLSGGLNAYASVGLVIYAWFALWRGAIAAEYASELGSLAMRICDRYPDSPMRGFALGNYACHLHIAMHHPAAVVPYLRATLKADFASFSFMSASFFATLNVETQFIGNPSLADAVDEARKNIELLRSPLNYSDMHLTADGFTRVWCDLQAGASALVQFPSPAVQEIEQKIVARKASLSHLYFFAAKCAALYLVGRAEQAVEAGRVAEQHAHAAPGQNVTSFILYPYLTLAELAVLRRVTEEAPRAALEAEAARHLALMGEAAKISPPNLTPILKLLQAVATEVVRHDTTAAAAAYDEACTALHERCFPLFEGAALTLAGNNAAALGMRAAAQHFYADACRTFATYGATTLVAALVRTHGPVCEPRPPPHAPTEHCAFLRAPTGTAEAQSPARRTSSRASSGATTPVPCPPVDRSYLPLTAQLDAYTVLQVTRALSQEIVLDKLLGEVVRILLENAGADCATLLLERIGGDPEKTLEVVAHQRTGGDGEMHASLETADRNSGEIMRYVHALREGVLLDNAFADTRFTPPAAHTTGVKSVLCLPLRAGHRLGVLYMENGAIAGAFSAARRELVEAIIPQIEISIEKASLVKALTEASKELARKNERLERADTHKDQFLAVTTHELRTPLHGIISATSLLIDSSPLTEEQREYASVVLSASKSLLTLVEDILDLTRIRASKLRIERRAFSIIPIVETVLEVLSGAAGEKGIDLAYEIDASGAGTAAADVVRTRQLTSDPLRLQQVIMNLLSNAIKFTPRGYVLLTVSLHGSGSGAQLRLSVKDTGVGIAAEKMPRLFQMFSQLDTPDPSRYDGYGVGLFICHSVVQLLGGTITAESDGRNGSTFVVTVPISVAATPTEDPDSDAKSAPVVTKYSSPTRCLVWATHAHTMRIVTAELTRVGLASEVCESAAAYSRALATYGATSCAVIDLAYAHEAMLMHDTVGKRPGGVVVLCSYVEWRRWERKEGFTPLFKPLQPRRVSAMVRSAFSSVPLPKDLKAPLVFSEVNVTRTAPPSLLGSAAHRTQGPATLPRTLSADTARLAANAPPLNSVSCAASSASGAPLTSSPSLRYVLVVEDNVLNAKMLCKMLGTLYMVETANNGLEAVESVKKRSPDLVLMDIQMPVMDGVAASQELRRLGFRMPIIAATASLSTSERELAFSAGMNDVLAKPFTKQGVLTLVRRHLFAAGSAKSGGPAKEDQPIKYA